jgi:23S rRNA pseudouridine1911/1915/1917 synthase
MSQDHFEHEELHGETLELIVHANIPERLDIYLADELEEISRSKVKAWCKEGRVMVEGLVRKSSFLVNEGMQITVSVPRPRELDAIEGEDIPLDILFEDEHIAIINKGAGMVVHPGAGVWSGTLVHALVYHFGKLTTRGGAMRPGIVHRLDKGTSGIILVAKTDLAHQNLTEQWQDGTVTKVYQALVWGVPKPDAGEVETHIGRHPRYRQMMAAEVPEGRWSKSRYKVTDVYPEASRVNVHILTGRTHQVRVHLAHLGHPVVGDALYGKSRHKNLAKSFPYMPEHPMLHAAMLRFRHPASGEEMTFKQKPPQDFLECLAHLEVWPS